MAKSLQVSTVGKIGLFFFALVLAAHGASIDSENDIKPRDLLKVMTQDFSGYNSQDAFSRPRYFLPTNNNPGRERMQAFIKYKFSNILGMAGGKEAGHVLHERPVTTAIKVNGKTTQVSAVNYLVQLSQKVSDVKEDQPIVILANYDTESGTGTSVLNPVEENGSGVAALLVLGEKLAAEIHSGALQLKHSIILAAVDASLLKYTGEDGLATNATTGADEVATKFLPEFLVNRPKGIRGVIVLDNLMNFQADAQTQHTTGFDRSYPKAYAEIASGNFAGDFVGIVARGDELDRTLVEVIENTWNQTKVDPNTVPETDEQGQPIPMLKKEPRLIKFEHDISGAQGEGYIHFLKSDQASFWNYKSEVIKPYPAILLTDTRSYRVPVCPENQRNCDNFEQTTSKKNLDFAHRTLLTVYETVIILATGGATRLSGMLTFIPILVAAVRYLHF